MKFLSLVLLASLSAGVVEAQDAPKGAAAPGVEVTKNSWRREVRNPALDEDPLIAHHEQRALERAQKELARENKIRAGLGLEQLPPVNGVKSSRSDGGPYVEYVYEIRVANTGAKTIRALEWGYVLLDPVTGSEAGHTRFLHEAGIRPGKSKSLVGRSPSPPARVINVLQSGRETQGQFSERIVIHRIFYEDRTAWTRPSN